MQVENERKRKRKPSKTTQISTERAQQLSWSLSDVNLIIDVDGQPMSYSEPIPKQPKEAVAKKRRIRRDPMEISQAVANLSGAEEFIQLGIISLPLHSFVFQKPLTSQWQVRVGAEPHSCNIWDLQTDTLVASGSLGLPQETLRSLHYLLRKGFLLLTGDIDKGSEELTPSQSTNLSNWKLRLRVSLTSKVTEDVKSGKSPRAMSQRQVLLHFLPQFSRVVASPFARSSLQNNFDETFEDSQSNSKASHSGEIEAKIYASVRRTGNEPSLPQPPELLPTLRGYQRRAAAWMVAREQVSQSSSQGHPLWIECHTNSGDSFAWQPWTGAVTSTLPSAPPEISGGILADEMGLGKTLEVLTCVVSHRSPPLPIPPKPQERVACVCGARDETAQVSRDVLEDLDDEDYQPEVWLLCDGCNVWQHAACVGVVPRGSFYCEGCLEGPKDPIAIRGTLLVTPSSISGQWLREIERHVTRGALKVFHYKGVREKWISPRALASYDIIVTDFDTLRNELHHVDVAGGYSLRSPKRYQRVPTPLAAVKLWRVVVDECQMVENPSAAAEMVRQIPAVHRWCVSGTIMPRGLGDLRGLLGFLGIEPWGNPRWWNRLEQSYLREDKGAQEELDSLLRNLLWRNSKLDVQQELDLPPQRRSLISLRFSPVEKYFYHKQHETIRSELFSKISKLQKSRGNPNSPPRGQRKITHRDRKALLVPLLRLRQACCHHQVGSRGIRTLQKNTMSTDELLEQLVLKAHVECEEALRQLVSALNGISAIALLQDEPLLAVKTYCTAWDTFDSHSGAVRVDPLQRLHILHNLLDAVELLSRKTGTSLQEVQVGTAQVPIGNAISELKEVRGKYLANASAKVETLNQNFQRIREEVIRAEREWDETRGKQSWMDNVLDQLQQNSSLAREFIDKFREDLLAGVQGYFISDKDVESSCRFLRARDISGMAYLLTRHSQRFYEFRETALKTLERYNRSPTDEEIFDFSNCSQCHSKKGPKCSSCQMEDVIVEYEKELFFSYATSNPVNALRAGENLSERRSKSLFERTSRSTSEAETFSRSLWSFVKQNSHLKCFRHLVENHSEETSAQFEFYDLSKKEFKVAKELWKALRDQVAAFDEVDMAVSRIQLRAPGEEVSPQEAFFKLQPHDVDFQRIKNNADKEVATISLNRALGQLAYLQKLSSRGKTTEENKTCSVCYEAMGAQYVILACGHDFCEQCVVAMTNRSKGQTLKCPTCRNRVNISEISYVMDNLKEGDAEKENNPDDIPVRGSYGTKIEGVVRQLLRIQRNNPTAKSLVFSEWQDVLELISRALKENEITYILPKGKRTFQKDVERFQTENSIRVLLLPVKSGANGLNLVEATHVLLVEPLLNPGEEAQAVGRVHRIGQRKESTVYQFIMKDTIEEKVYEQARRKESHSTTEELKQKEEVSIEEIKGLFADDKLQTIGDTPVVVPQDGKEEEDEEVAEFWNQNVVKNGVILPRSRALEQLQLVRSWELKEEGKSIRDEPTQLLMGKRITVKVSERLLALSLSQ